MTDPTLPVWDGRDVERLAAEWGAPRLEAYACTDSTNDRLQEMARAGAPAFSVVVADAQRAGRGRRGRSWVSEPGRGLLMSVLLPRRDLASSLPLVVGLIVARAIEGLAPGVSVGLKWPNDLWIAGKKVGGILCEAGTYGVVCGIGVNVRPPEGEHSFETPATSLEVEGMKMLGRNELARSVVRGLGGRLRDGEAGLQPLEVEELAGRDVLRGRRIHSETEGPGVSEGITARGELLLRQDSGSLVQVVAGSVRLR